MWQKYLLLTVVIMFLFIHTLADTYPHPYPLSESKTGKRYCGTELADFMAFVCQGIYNMPTYKKSIYDDSDEDYTFDQQPVLEDTRLTFPFRTRQNAAALIPGSFRRFTRGITDECCKKACTRSEVMAYCAKF